MKGRPRRQFDLLVWRGRLWPALVIGGLFAAFAAGLFLLNGDFRDAPRAVNATLISQRGVQTDEGNRLRWMIETDDGRILSVSSVSGLAFEEGRTVCIEERTGRLLGLVRARVVNDGRCDAGMRGQTGR